MKTTTNKHILKKVAKQYAASILVHVDGGVTKYDTKVPMNDLDYIIYIVSRIGKKMGGRLGISTLDKCYDLFVNQDSGE